MLLITNYHRNKIKAIYCLIKKHLFQGENIKIIEIHEA